MADESAVLAAPLKRSTKLLYSLPQMPLMMAILPMIMFLPPFYTGERGIDLAVFANILLAVSVFDIVTDPIIGYLSDKTKTRFGRRRPWIVAGLPVMMVSIYFLFVPGPNVDWGYVLFWMMGLRLGWTMIHIPYYAWGAELSHDYNERSSITGWRAAFGIIGSLSIQVILALALLGFDIGGTENALNLVALIVLFTLPFSVALSALFVPEPQEGAPSVVSLFRGLQIMWRNGPFRRLMLAFMVGNMSYAMNLQLFLFYIGSVIGDPRAFAWLLLVSNGAAMIAVGPWVKLSERIGKHRTWIAGYLLVSFVSVFYLLLGQGDIGWVVVLVAIGGLGAATFEAMPQSMKADVIDLDTLKSGENRAAWFFAAWSFVTKASATIAGWFTLRALDFFGFQPQLGPNNGPDELFALKALFGLGPAFFMVVAAMIAWNYPITQDRHMRLRTNLARRNARRAAAAK